jgi:hypothetical protein
MKKNSENKGEKHMSTANPKRVSPEEVHRKLASGDGSLLVCIYPTEVFEKSHLEGAISLEEFESRLGGLPKTAEIAFY